MANAAYQLTLQGTNQVRGRIKSTAQQTLEGTTDGNGRIERPVPVNAQRGTLAIGSFIRDLEIGYLNPPSETGDEGVSGMQARLANLGFDPGPVDGQLRPPHQGGDPGLSSATPAAYGRWHLRSANPPKVKRRTQKLRTYQWLPCGIFSRSTMTSTFAGHGYQKSLTCGADLSLWSILIAASANKPNDKTEAEDAAIWGDSVPAIGGGVHLPIWICRVKSMDYMNMGVSDSIDWGPVTFTSEHTSGPVTLPLETEFLWKSRILSAGTITGDDKYWKLYAKPIIAGNSSSLMNSGTLKHGEARTDGEDGPPGIFTEKLGKTEPCFSVSAGTRNGTLRVSPLRIMVVVTLVCCKLRDDFDPGGALEQGCIHDHGGQQS